MLRYLPPSAAPISLFDILAGLLSCINQASLRGFKEDICRYFSVRYCYLASSGRAALSMLFRSLHNLKPERDEVLLPAFTSFSVPSAVAHAGLKVSLYDLDRDTLSPDVDSLCGAISDKTLCIVVCHLYGYPCDMSSVLSVAKQSGVPVIDDAAQAMGATYRGRMVGTLGKAGLFSLSRGKNISTVDGGILVTNSPQLAAELERQALAPLRIREHLSLIGKSIVLSLLLHPMLYGIPARISSLKLGASVFEPNFPEHQFTSFQAGIGRRMLRRLKRINSARRQKAKLIANNLASHAKLPQIVAGAEPVFLRLPVYVRDASASVRINLGIVPSYPTSLDEIKSLQPLLINRRTFPTAGALAREIVTLPTHQYLNSADINEITQGSF
jgi:perosamine synthetase